MTSRLLFKDTLIHPRGYLVIVTISLLGILSGCSTPPAESIAADTPVTRSEGQEPSELPSAQMTSNVECPYIMELRSTSDGVWCCWAGQQTAMVDGQPMCVGQPQCPDLFIVEGATCTMPEETRFVLERECNDGVASACLAFGRAFRDGINVGIDDERAVSYLDRGCEFGSNRACVEWVRLWLARGARETLGMRPQPLGRMSFFHCDKPRCPASNWSDCRMVYELMNDHSPLEQIDLEYAATRLDKSCSGEDIGCRDLDALRWLFDPESVDEERSQECQEQK